jgi:hypothetical protein
MAKYIVKYQPKNELHTRYIQGVKFIIGDNEVPPSKYPALTKDPTFIRLVENGVFVDMFANANLPVNSVPEAVQPPVETATFPTKRTAKKEVEAVK